MPDIATPASSPARSSTWIEATVVPSDWASFACASTVASPERTMAMPLAAAAAIAAAVAIFTRAEKAARRAFAASISRPNRPKPRLPASPTPSSSARTSRPPTTASRTLTRFSAMAVSDRLVEPAHHHRLDLRQQLGRGHRLDAKRGGERQRRAHVPADHRAGDDPELAAEAQGEVPDLPAVMGLRAVQPRRAVRARLPAGRAVAVAPAEVPVGEGAEAFFSASSSRPFET